MRGVVCQESGVALRLDLPEPVAHPGEVLLRVRVAGICDTDLQLARGYLGFRGILGHEFVGETDDGRRVTGEINNECHACPTCLSGQASHCPNRTVMGIVNHDGAMADKVAVPVRNLHEIPSEIDDRTAVFVEPLAAAFRVLEQGNVQASTRAMVLGDGKLGMLCAWVICNAGARVTLVGKHAEKLVLAGESIVTRLLSEAGDLERSMDLVVDATGSGAGLAAALRFVRPMGTVVLKTTIAARHELDLAPAVINEVRIVGSRCGPFPQAIEALRDRRMDVTRLIEADYSLNEAEQGFRIAARPGARKVLLWI